MKLRGGITCQEEKKSHPAGVRGLKLGGQATAPFLIGVAPRRGAWVETMIAEEVDVTIGGRTPQGCVG